MALDPARRAKVDDELKRAAGYFERLAGELDPRQSAEESRAAWAKTLQIMVAIEELRHLLAQEPG
jgi:hypothetical protein